MSLFRRKQNTTENLFLGNPEAESEGNIRAKVKLDDVFYDYLKVLPEIETEKFIVTGRKGSGKSAIGQVLFKRSKNDGNKFCEYIQKSDIDLEEIVQFSETTGEIIQKELLFKWIILTRLLKLITQNQAVQGLNEIKIIRHFLEKNTGFVRIDKYEIKEILQTTGVEVLIEKLMHFFTYKKSRETKLTGTKAPFYKLIPHLEEVVISILNSNADKYQGNSYQIIFDDLDIEFKAENSKSVETVLNLIRIAKNYNNNLFSENNIDAKIIILLRDDISDILIKKSADMAKVFSSYSISLMWFDHELYKKGENLTMLKQFIDNRIKFDLNKEDIDFEGNSWDFLFEKSNSYNDSSFKYVIDHTFQTPRDLILFMQDLSKFKFNIPLQFNDVNTLIGSYSNKAKGEIENALAIHFNVKEIDNVFLILKSLSRPNDFSFDTFKTEYEKYEMSIIAEKCCELLFDYSLIGNKNPNNNMVFFKHRENNETHYSIDFEKCFVIHRIIKIYFLNVK
jgi:Cdc6-like AAA superfamily ATPase